MSVVFPAHNKYKNRPVGGYSSRKEAKRAQELKLMQKAGLIRDLKEQVPYIVIPAQRDPNTWKHLERAAKYVADFVYEEIPFGLARLMQEGQMPQVQWREVVEDSKGVRTAEYILKRKLMLKVHGIRIRET